MPTRKNSARTKLSMLPEWFTTVTPFSKALAMTMFIILPFIGFVVGMKYQRELIGDSAPFEVVVRRACDSAGNFINPGTQTIKKMMPTRTGMMTPWPSTAPGQPQRY